MSSSSFHTTVYNSIPKSSARLTSAKKRSKNVLPKHKMQPSFQPTMSESGHVAVPTVQTSVELRPYQARIIDTAVEAHTLVVLPTGAGKTLIAAEVIRRLGTPSIFLVPTRLLTVQQCTAIHQWTGLDVRAYAGGHCLPEDFEVLVCTPQAFIDARNIGHHRNLCWDQIKVVVFDEVHHSIKSHPYRRIAEGLRQTELENRPRIIGLTASYTYEVTRFKAICALQRLCSDFEFERLQSATDEELRVGGYHATKIPTQLPYQGSCLPLPKGILPSGERPQHQVVETFLDRIRDGEATTFSQALATCVLFTEEWAMSLDDRFSKPMSNRDPIKGWSLLAHRMASDQEEGSTEQNIFMMLEQLYEAIKLLMLSWEEDEFAAVLMLELTGFGRNLVVPKMPENVSKAFEYFWKIVPKEFPKLDRLKRVLLQKSQELGLFRGIIFVQQRIYTHILEYFIEQDPDLSKLFRPTCLYASNTPASPSLSIPKSVCIQRVQDFADGKVNLLISTVVAEEGIDIAAANCVIRFNSMNHVVSLVQGRGRARQEHSSFVVLEERKDRSMLKLSEAEKLQRDLLYEVEARMLGTYMEEEKSGSSITTEEERTMMIGIEDKKEEKEVNNEEYGIIRQADNWKKLRARHDDRADRTKDARDLLNQMCNDAKVVPKQSFGNHGQRIFSVTITVEVLGIRLTAHGQGPQKKIAKRIAAENAVKQWPEMLKECVN